MTLDYSHHLPPIVRPPAPDLTPDQVGRASAYDAAFDAGPADTSEMVCPACYSLMHHVPASGPTLLYACSGCGRIETQDAITAYWNNELTRILSSDGAPGTL